MKINGRNIALIFEAILLLVMPCTTTIAKEKVADNVGYHATNFTWNDNGKGILLEGYLYNSSDKYDIFHLSDAKIAVYDGKEKKMFTVELDDDKLSEVVLPPWGMVTYNISRENLKFKPSKYNLKAGMFTRLSCKFKYDECEGSNCTRCGGQTGGNNTGNANTGYPYVSRTPESSAGTIQSPSVSVPELCGACKGGKWCPTCKGLKTITNLGVTTDCSACKGTGICWKCGGSGYK